MSISRCIPGLLEQGKLSQEQADRARELFDGHSADLARSMSPAAAEAVATGRTLAAVDFEALERRRRSLLQVKAADFAEDWLTRGGEHWGGGAKGSDGRGGSGGGFTPGEGPVGPISPKAAKTLVGLTEARRKAIEGEAFGHIRDVLAKHRKTLTGSLRNPAEMDELGRAAFGETEGVGLAAKELAGAVAETQDWLRLRANAAGANIGKLENRGFSTHHDSRKVAETGFDAWWAAERPRWDLDRMIDEDSGQPFTGARLNEAARAVFDTIASDGASKREPGSFGRSSFVNQLGQHRFIHYKDYEDWAASQAQFGAGTAFDALLGEVKGMSRAIAAMEILGPNPEATVRYAQDRLSGDASLRQPGQLRRRDKQEGTAKVVQRLWDEYMGALRQPENRRMAMWFSNYRAVASAAKLGSAAPKSISDMGYGMATRRFNGLPIAGIVGDYLKLINPFDKSDRLLAARLGFVAETWASQVSGTHRFLAEELTGEVARRIADGVLRASGLNAITDAGRMAHGLVTFVHLTSTRHQGWAELEPAWRAALERYRIGEKEWDAIRSAEPSTDIGLVEPAAIADQELRSRFLEMAHSEMDFAVPVPDLETRSYLGVQARKGTWWGEIQRSSPLMFKTFMVSVMLRHGGRMVEQSGVAGKLGYFLSVIAPVTVVGMLATQLLEMGTKGRDARPMDPTTKEGRNTWVQALSNGGGAGILSDLAGVTAENRYMGWAQYAAGPLLGDVSQIAGDAVSLIGGKPEAKAKAPWKLAKDVRQQVPGQNLWYMRLVLDRMLADQVQREIDPNHDDSWRAMERRAAEQGQEYYWAPGDPRPRRAPDFANALEGGPRQ